MRPTVQQLITEIHNVKRELQARQLKNLVADRPELDYMGQAILESVYAGVDRKMIEASVQEILDVLDISPLFDGS